MKAGTRVRVSPQHLSDSAVEGTVAADTLPGSGYVWVRVICRESRAVEPVLFPARLVREVCMHDRTVDGW